MNTLPRYRILDEPRRSLLQSIAVHPQWPLFALMFGGVWLSWPWSVLNGFALGAPSRVRDTAFVAAGFAGSLLFAFALRTALTSGLVPESVYPWGSLIVMMWKLFVSYFVYEHQQRASNLHVYFGGHLRNGAPVAFLAGYLGRQAILDAVYRMDDLVLFLVLS